jgi:hypothetical protein
VLQVARSGSDSIGVYDGGSPDIAGFEGIARWSTFPNHWPISRQGNFVLWGFDAPVEQMTDAGKLLFVNLLISHKLRPEAPLSQALKKQEYIQPGAVSAGPVGGLVGIEGGVVSGVFNLESSGVSASDGRPRHDERYHEA